MLVYELLEFVKILLRFDGTGIYDKEVTLLIKSSIQILERQGVGAPPQVEGHEMYAQCVAFQVALNVEGFEIRETRMQQLRMMYENNILLLKGE